MIKKTFFTFYLFCLLFLHSLFGQILQFENQIIERLDIVVHTNTEICSDNAAILSRLSTKQGGFFSQAEFDKDLKTLAQDFDRIEPLVESLDHQVSIKLDLWPKPTIRHIKWCGNHQVATKRLQRELGINCFSVYDRQAFNEAFQKLAAYYTRKGFFEAQLDYQVTPIPDKNEVDIFIDIQEGRSGKIQEIIFVNFTEDEECAILKQMITKKYNIFTSLFTQEGIYNEEAIQQDQLIITNYLQNEGYADAQVHIDVAESCKTNRILVTITADKGERYYFGYLSFEGNKVLSNEEIDCLFLARPGQPFSLEQIRDTIEGIKDAYGVLGYIDAIVDFEPQLVEGHCFYNVRFTIEEGEQFRVGMIRVFGNVSTKTHVILHETLITPGEIFNSIKLKKTEERLQNIGYFKNVNVYIAKGTESSRLEGNYRDVYIEVEETNTGQFSAFVGYSSVEEIFGGITITEKNFNHQGFAYLWRDGFQALRGGGEYLNFTTQIGQKSRNYVLSWTKPHFLDTKWSIGFDLGKASTRYISKDYDLETIGLNIRAQYDINPYLRAGLHYRLQNGIVHLHKDASESDSSSEPSYIRELREDARIHGLISAVGASLSYNSTDHPIKPRQGFRSRLFLEYAGVGGDHTFLSLGYLNSYFLPLGSRNVIRYRADFRFIQPLGHTRYETLPLDERIFLGGENTIRGYRPYRLGPHYEGEDHIPRGGLSMQLYSVEFNRRVTRNCEAFAFFDAGQLGKRAWEFARLNASVGYGVRIKLIESIPQVTLGMGYPLNARHRSEVKKFFISLGGNF